MQIMHVAEDSAPPHQASHSNEKWSNRNRTEDQLAEVEVGWSCL